MGESLCLKTETVMCKLKSVVDDLTDFAAEPKVGLGCTRFQFLFLKRVCHGFLFNALHTPALYVDTLI